MITERNITAYLHTRRCAQIMIVIFIAATVAAYYTGHIQEIGGNRGFGLPPVDDWIPSGAASLWTGITVNIASMLLTAYLTKRFNTMRSMSDLSIGLAAFMTGAVPSVAGQLCGGTLLCVTVISCCILLMSTYGDPYRRQRVFLLFFIVATLSFTQYAFIFYIPVFIVGCIQMRIFNFKTLLAAGIGMITPPWILFGSGILRFSEIELPQFTSALTATDDREAIPILVTAGVTILAGIGFTAANLVKVIAYNSRTRSFNGLLSLLLITTAILVIIDFNNMSAYLPLLYCMTAYQAAHFFSIRRRTRSYIGILVIIVAYTLIYIWNLWI